MGEKKNIAITFGITGNYAFALGNVLIGLKKHSPNLNADIIVFEQGVSEKDKILLNSIIPCNFIQYKFPDDIFLTNDTLKRFSELTFSRFECFKLLGQYKNVLWLDVDILIQKDVTELLNEKENIDYRDAARILRDMNGHNDKKIGYTNEKAINQLIAHHSVIFNATKLLVWVSTSPYQMGEYVCYDLNKVFSIDKIDNLENEINTTELLIPADSLIYTDTFAQIMEYKSMLVELNDSIKMKKNVSQDFINKFIFTNKEYYLVYSKTGDYYFNKDDFANALQYYEIALKKEITTLKDKIKIELQLSKCKETAR